MTVLLAAVLALGVLGLAGTTALCASRVRRLHRLHIRLDAARAGLDAALARRAAAAAAAGLLGTPGEAAPGSASRPPAGGRGTPARLPAAAGERTGAAATAGEGAGWPGSAGESTGGAAFRREEAANALARRLAGLDRAALTPPVRAALEEAEELLVLARRVHNDAVRDTLGLRSRRLVRWLRLAGTAAMPTYFETAEPPATEAVTSGTPDWPAA